MPKKSEGYTQLKNHAKQDRKRREAYARQDNYDSLTVTEKIALAVKRGGSVRELARLRKTYVKTVDIAPPAKPVVAEVKEAATAKPKRTRKSDVVKAAKAERPTKS